MKVVLAGAFGRLGSDILRALVRVRPTVVMTASAPSHNPASCSGLVTSTCFFS